MNNKNKRGIGYDSQTGQPIYEQEDSNKFNNQKLVKKEKSINYYRKLLNIDTITLLIISILFMSINMIFQGNGYDEAVPIFLKSILFIICEIIILCHRKEINLFLGIETLILGSLMILTSIGDGSLFGLVYFMLGLFYIIHSILFIKKVKTIKTDDEIKSNSKLKYFTIIPVILLPIVYTVNLFFLEVPYTTFIIIIYFIITILNVIFSIWYQQNNKKSILVSICLVISIIIVMFDCLLVPESIKECISEINYQKSDEYKMDIITKLENILKNNIYTYAWTKQNTSQEEFIYTKEQMRKDLTDYINSENYKEDKEYCYEYESKEHCNLVFNNKSSLESLEDEFLEQDIKCDGYALATFNEEKYNNQIEEYKSQYDEKIAESFISIMSREKYFDVNVYLSCNSGDFNYKTTGYDESKLGR